MPGSRAHAGYKRWIGIVGAGAMGCVYAALMTDRQRGLGRQQAHDDAIDRQRAPARGRRAAIEAATTDPAIGPCERHLATKAAQVEAAATGARALLGPERRF